MRAASVRGLAALSIVVLAAGACAVPGNLLGGREKCWPDTDTRVASLWRGTLRIDANATATLDTPEGDVIRLASPVFGTSAGPEGAGFVDGDRLVARAGDDVSLFGGAGADGILIVCAIEENRGPA